MIEVFGMGVCVGVILALLFSVAEAWQEARDRQRAQGRRLVALRQAVLECKGFRAGDYLLLKNHETLTRAAVVTFHRKDAAEVFDSFVQAMANQVRAEGVQ